jgi:predicted acyl esterase
VKGRRRLGAAAAVAAALMSTLGPGAGRAAPPPAVDAASAVPPDLARFFGYKRPPLYDSVRRAVRVPMRDGVSLGCYLYEPATKGTTRPAPGRFPGIVNNFSPYYIAYPVGAFHGDYFAERGYLDIECTPRGTGLSGGTFDGWLSGIEGRDNYDLIEWLAHRPNATGKVGQQGNSYGGMTAYRVAALHPPSLLAIAPQQAYSSMYLDYAYPGGIRSLGDPYWWVFAGAVGFIRPMLSAQEARWLLHPTLDSYWKQIDIDTKWDRIDVPVLGFGGWIDIFQDGMVRNHIGLAGPDTYLIDGPWDHASTFDATVTLGALLAWFDHWLYEDPDAPMPPTPVASFVMPKGPWQALPEWPPADAAAQALALTSGGSLATTAGPAGARSYVVNPAAGVVDLRAGDHLEFVGPPLSASTTIAGAGTVRLRAALTDPLHVAVTPSMVDTSFVLHLYDVDPSGHERLVTRGYLKASHRRSHTDPTAVPLGRAVDYVIPLWHVHHRFAAGHHLVLRLLGGEESCCLTAAPAAAQPLLPFTVTLATGAGGSTLTFPTRSS